jgi:hemerythrin-like domain-containing protein
MARDILKTLKDEHDALQRLFEEAKGTTDRAVKTRVDLLENIENSLIPHAKWEEDVFYPAFRERADRDGVQVIAEAYAEHHAVENSVIPDVHEAEPGTPEFAGRLKVFGELVKHHAKEEEGTMFRMARELFSAEELAQLDEDYAAWKAAPDTQQVIVSEKAKAASRTAGAATRQ